MDFGRYIFDHTIKHAKTNAVKLPIAFPTLLCNVMIQHLHDLNDDLRFWSQDLYIVHVLGTCLMQL